MDAQSFTSLPTTEVARLVRATGPKVCVFPINGTRRWFALEFPGQAATGLGQAYMRIGGQRHIELYKLFFDHGVDTLLTPIFGPDLLKRGYEYQQLMVPALSWFAQNQDFLDWYDSCDVRVHVYGDAQRYLGNTPYAPALEAYAELARRTAHHRTFRLFFGVCAHDPAETIAEISVRFWQEHGRLPRKRELVEAYYGEYVEPVDLFIGFERPAAFDMPLVATGSEDLYFTVSPSPYLDAHTLRAILYDHLYSRRASETYAELSPQDWQALAEFYRMNRDHVLGLGRKHSSESFWYPLPQVTLPPQW
jgi:adenosine tuberculosinyltransferase